MALGVAAYLEELEPAAEVSVGVHSQEVVNLVGPCLGTDACVDRVTLPKQVVHDPRPDEAAGSRAPHGAVSVSVSTHQCPSHVPAHQHWLRDGNRCR